MAERGTVAIAVAAWGVALAAACGGHARSPDDEDGRYERPIDHFMAHAKFRAVFYALAAAPGEPRWPAAHGAVDVTKVTCTVREEAGGRRASCVNGMVLGKAFATLVREDEPPPGKELVSRLGECYAVRDKAWSKPELAAYEVALRADPKALPPATPAGDAYVVAWIAHDEAPFVGHCSREADGTCIYSADGRMDEATLEVRATWQNKPVTLPFEPASVLLQLSFEDGSAPGVIAQAGIHVRDGAQEATGDPSKVAWGPVIAFYEANEPASPNLPVALALGGRVTDPRARATLSAAGLGAGEVSATDPCGPPAKALEVKP